MNTVTLIGNLATDVDVRDVGEDKKVASFVLAVDRPGADAGADFVRIAVWNRQAEVCAEFLCKGERIALEGRLKSRSWEDGEGNRRSAIEVVANRVQFLSTRGSRTSEEAPFEAATPA